MFSLCRELQSKSIPVNVIDDTTETEAFCRMFNKFFDCFNTRNLDEQYYKCNDDLKPYRDVDDERVKVKFYSQLHLIHHEIPALPKAI